MPSTRPLISSPTMALGRPATPAAVRRLLVFLQRLGKPIFRTRGLRHIVASDDLWLPDAGKRHAERRPGTRCSACAMPSAAECRPRWQRAWPSKMNSHAPASRVSTRAPSGARPSSAAASGRRAEGRLRALTCGVNPKSSDATIPARGVLATVSAMAATSTASPAPAHAKTARREECEATTPSRHDSPRLYF